jgi:excinuclease ABC subunit A
MFVQATGRDGGAGGRGLDADRVKFIFAPETRRHSSRWNIVKKTASGPPGTPEEVTRPPHAAAPQLALRGVRVHNLQGIDLDLPLGRFLVITGVSGAGKSSLAFDTLYAEGQRRYVESFPTYSRQFLERLEEPAADFIGPIPPAIAVRQSAGAGARRATLGSGTEILDHLRLLFARAGEIVCPACGTRVESHSPSSVAKLLTARPAGRRMQIGFSIWPRSEAESDRGATDLALRLAELTRAGFTRAVLDGTILPLADVTASALRKSERALVIVDRLQTMAESGKRLTDSLETAFREGGAAILVESSPAEDAGGQTSERLRCSPTILIDDRPWRLERYHTGLVCGGCLRVFSAPTPALFNFQSPLGACPACRGMGTLEGDDTLCPACRGTRLRPEALAVQVGGRSFPEWITRTIAEVRTFVENLPADRAASAGELLRRFIPPIVRRLALLEEVGLGYLSLDRPWRTLSRGEAQRARLAGASGSNLVNLLYVLDEPTTGLHPDDTERLLGVLLRLRDAGNTVIAVEHDPAVITKADFIVDLGPEAGKAGGRVLYQGPPAGLTDCAESITGDFLSGRRQVAQSAGHERRQPAAWLSLREIHHHNLRGISVAIPLEVLCVVSGVSGSGKSSLVVETLLPIVEDALASKAVAARGTRPGESPRAAGRAILEKKGLPDSIAGTLFLDAAPIGRSPRSQPASFLGIFGEIRSLFAGTAEAKVRNLTARHFSFNAAGGGRCETCAGAGSVAVDMQFLPDVVVNCPDCQGTRYRREILDVKYRGLSITEVLALTAQEAFAFFRGRTRIQRRLKSLKDAGLEYLQLGQPARTFSGGESQRLKLAAFLAQRTRARTLIVLEEPTTGLHPRDIGRLLDCWNGLLAAGHSLVVIEHNPQVIASADYVIDLGPGAGPAGGRVVAAGTPEQIAAQPESVTGRFLKTEPGQKRP